MATTTTSTRSQRRPRLLATVVLAVLAVLAAAVLGACGDGGKSLNASSSARNGSTATATDAPAPAPNATRSLHPNGGSDKSEGSASFRVVSGDNSIPDFGAEAGVPQRDRAATTLAAYLGARARAQWSTACTFLSRQVRAQLESLARTSKGKVKGCSAVLAALENRTPPGARADTFVHGLASLRVKGPRGFALYYGPHRQQYVLPLASETGTWKVTQLAPIPYPIDSPTSPAG